MGTHEFFIQIMSEISKKQKKKERSCCAACGVRYATGLLRKLSNLGCVCVRKSFALKQPTQYCTNRKRRLTLGPRGVISVINGRHVDSVINFTVCL